jgi:hypothetical protein
MAERTITSADSTFVISSADFALPATILEGYAADAAFAMEAAQTAETAMGVDGVLSAGWVPRAYVQTVTLQADSPSRDVFDAIVQAQDAERTIYRINGVITLPGNQRSFSLVRGVVTQHQAMPDAQRVLQATAYQITWQRVLPVPIA